MSLLQENVYFSYRKVNKNAYFTLFEVNKNVNLVIFNMSKIAFCRFATLVAFFLIVLTVLMVLSALSGWSKGYISLMHPLLILCLSYAYPSVRFR